MKKNNQTEIHKLKIKKQYLADLPIFYHYILYNCFAKGRLLNYHYNSELQCFMDYQLLDKPISKFE